MHTLVEAADQLEGSIPAKARNEEERVVFPVYGEIFDESGYKVIVRAFATQQSTPTAVEEQGQPDWKDGETPQEKIQEKEVANEQDDVTQEPTSLNIPIEITTRFGIEEPENEFIPNFVEEDCTVTPEPFHDTEIIEIEPHQ